MTEYLPLLMFLCLLLFIILGFPVAFTLSGTALWFALIGYSLDMFHLSDLGFIPSRIFGVVENFTLVAVPLFIFMGLMLEKSGVAEELLETISRLFNRYNGSLAIAVIVVGALLAASTGIVGATVVTMGIISLPTMITSGYNKELATGTVAAAGTLGQIIPPSIILVLLGDIMNVDVADLFMASVFPGLLLVLSYIIYVLVLVRIYPKLAPKLRHPGNKLSKLEIINLLKSLFAPFSLMGIVLGSILLGLASPTEAAALGATGAMITAMVKKKFNKQILKAVMNQTARITSMVFLILIGAQFFSVVFRGLFGDDAIRSLIDSTELTAYSTLFILMLLLFILGFFLDFFEICFIVIPMFMPIIHKLGYNPLWIAVLIAVNLQTSFLTPPFGFALFYLKGVAPKEVTTLHIYRGIVPFVALQLFVLLVLAIFPDLVLWLPKRSF